MKKKIQKLLNELKVLMSKDGDNIGIILHVYSDYSGCVMSTDLDTSDDDEELLTFNDEWELISNLKSKIKEFDKPVKKIVKDYFPERWEDLETVTGVYINDCSKIYNHSGNIKYAGNKNVTTSIARAKHILAYCQLSQIAQRCNENNEVDRLKFCTYPGVNGKLGVWSGNENWINDLTRILFNSKEDLERSIIAHKDLWNDYYGITNEAED